METTFKTCSGMLYTKDPFLAVLLDAISLLRAFCPSFSLSHITVQGSRRVTSMSEHGGLEVLREYLSEPTPGDTSMSRLKRPAESTFEQYAPHFVLYFKGPIWRV